MDALRRYLAEFLGTALLVIAGVGVAVLAPDAGPVGIAVDFGLTLLVLARSVGPALFAGGSALSQLWVFLVFPLVGGVLAAVAYRFLPMPLLVRGDTRHHDSTAVPGTGPTDVTTLPVPATAR